MLDLLFCSFSAFFSLFIHNKPLQKSWNCSKRVMEQKQLNKVVQSISFGQVQNNNYLSMFVYTKTLTRKKGRALYDWWKINKDSLWFFCRTLSLNNVLFAHLMNEYVLTACVHNHTQTQQLNSNNT